MAASNAVQLLPCVLKSSTLRAAAGWAPLEMMGRNALALSEAEHREEYMIFTYIKTLQLFQRQVLKRVLG